MKLQPANMLEWQPSLQVSVVMGDDEQAIRQRTQEDKQYDDIDLQREICSQNRVIIEKYKDDFSEFLTIKKLLYFLCVPTLCF